MPALMPPETLLHSLGGMQTLPPHHRLSTTAGNPGSPVATQAPHSTNRPPWLLGEVKRGEGKGERKKMKDRREIINH